MLTTFGKDRPVFKHKFKDVRFSRGNAFINAGYYNNGSYDELKSRYIAMFTADGSMSPDGYVTFCFSKTRKVERCKHILDMLGVEYSLNEHHRKSGVINYRFYVGKRTDYLLDGYVDRYKRISMNCVHNLNIGAFLDEVQYWDATYTRARNKQSIRFATCVKETAEVMQIMCALDGKKTTIRIDDYNHKTTDGKHSLIYYINYKINRSDEHTFMSAFSPDFTKPIVQDVYCVNMPKGTLVIRHNGKVSIQGNCDYSQLELRVASWLSGDINMQHAYQSGSDLHSKTTELLFGDTSGLSHDEQKRKRTQSKSANFGFLYGMVAKTFIQYALGFGLTLTQEESEKIRADFFKAYPRLLVWHEECKEFARQHGYIESPIGRKRWFDNINSRDFRKRSADERQAINSPVQGFGSDLCTSALADIVFSKELDHTRFNVLGSVHDAILFEIRDDYVEELVPKLKYMMEHPSIIEGMEVPIPLVADVEVSQSWGGH
jgi:gp096|nr:MAG TPA: DNA polymerase [Caudoviricetes sp.]